MTGEQQAGTAAPERHVPSAREPEGGLTGRDRELAALRRELAALRDEVARLRERVHHIDGELGFSMMTAGRLRGRLEREIEAREALEHRLAERGVVVLPETPAPTRPGSGQAAAAQSGSASRSRSAAARSGTRSFLTDVDT